MNILVIGSVRTKSTALTQHLHKKYPNHLYWGEPFHELTLRSNNLLIKDKEKFITSQVNTILDNLFSSKNNVIKILGINLYGMYRYIDKISIDKFDLINLIERKDFFDQVCSITVAKETKAYHRTKNNHIQYDKNIRSNQKKYTVNKDTIFTTANDVYNYLMIKKYLSDKKIPFIQYTYESISDIENISIMPNNINYDAIIDNYNIKNSINNLFSSYFDYDSLKSDIDGFKKELDNMLF